MRYQLGFSSLLASLVGLLLAGCSPNLPPQPGSPSSQGIELAFQFDRSSGVQAQYISSGTEGVSLQLGSNAAMDYSLSASSGNCQTDSSGTTICTLNVFLAPGSYPLTVMTYGVVPTSKTGGFSGDTPLSYATTQINVFPGQMSQLSFTLGAVVAKAELTPMDSNLILTTPPAAPPSSATNYDLAAAKTIPETFSLTLLDASGGVILQSAAGVPQVTLCSGNPGELSITPIGPGKYSLQALHSFGSHPQSLYLALGNCSGTPLTQYGSAAAIFLPTVTETQALYVSNPGTAGNGTILAYTAHGKALAFSASSGLSGPEGLAYDPTTGWLYAANVTGNTITAYNPVSGAQISSFSISGLKGPYGLAYDPTTGWLYAASSGNTITVYNPVSGAQISSFSISGLNGPVGLAYDPGTGWLYATNHASSISNIVIGNFTSYGITAYNPATGAQISGFSIGQLGSPAGLAYDPGTGWLYAANFTGNTITAYSPASGGQASSLESSGLDGPVGLAYDPGTGWLYAANFTGNTITAYSPASGAEVSATDFTSPTSSSGLSQPTFLAVIP